VAKRAEQEPVNSRVFEINLPPRDTPRLRPAPIFCRLPIRFTFQHLFQPLNDFFGINNNLLNLLLYFEQQHHFPSAAYPGYGFERPDLQNYFALSAYFY
jgi:hypothetical protein